MAISRRNMLRMSSGAAVASPLLAGLGTLFQPAKARAATVQTMTTACGICSPACGMKVTLEDGVVRFVEGLPGDLSGKGKLCGKGASAAGFLYDPDRLKYPMKRTNPVKGFDQDPGWVRISWAEALDTIAEKMASAKRDHGAESLLFVTLPGPDVLVRLMNAMGVMNRIDHIDECFLSDRIVQRYTTGGKSWCIDFVNSDFVLLFGWDILAKSKIVYATDLVEAKANGAKVVCFNPQYSTTARFADEWHNIRPGTDLAVALAMIQVLVSENLYNKEFVDKYTNFAEHETKIREHFRTYTPEWAEQQSGVPAAVTRRLARELGAAKAAIIPAHKKTLVANYANSTQLSHAISILNILAGTIDRPGGRYFARSWTVPGVDAVYPPPAYPAKVGRRVDGKDKLPFVLEDGGGMFSTLADGILNKYPGMTQFAFVNAYTALGFPQPKLMEQALASIPFLVTMDVLPTDTVNLSDIALPSAMYMEVNDIVTREYNAKVPQVVARRAVAPPIFEARGAGYVAVELGRRLTPEFFQTADGAVMNLTTLLEEKVKRAGIADSFAAFAERGMITREQPFTPLERFNTAGGSGKCQIYVPQFERGGEPLPAWHAKKERVSTEYPYYLLTYIPAVHKRNSTQNNKILNEMMGTNGVMLPPALAAKIGVKNGEMVKVWSRVGSIEAPAQISNTLREDCVMVAHGFGHRSRQLSVAGLKGVRDGDLIPAQSVDEVVAANNYGGAACIMEAVVNIAKGGAA